MSTVLFSYVLPLVHVTACLFLIVVVLLQTGKGADMGAVLGGGSQTLFGASGAGNLLTKLTTGMAITFMTTSLIIAVYQRERPGSGLLKRLPDAPPIAAPIDIPPPAVPAPDAAAPAPAAPAADAAPAPQPPVAAVPAPVAPDAVAPAPAPADAAGAAAQPAPAAPAPAAEAKPADAKPAEAPAPAAP
jgi:preprotein translocase subunit SecG